MSIGWIGTNADGNYIGPNKGFYYTVFGFPKNIANSVVTGLRHVESYKIGW